MIEMLLYCKKHVFWRGTCTLSILFLEGRSFIGDSTVVTYKMVLFIHNYYLTHVQSLS